MGHLKLLAPCSVAEVQLGRTAGGCLSGVRGDHESRSHDLAPKAFIGRLALDPFLGPSEPCARQRT